MSDLELPYASPPALEARSSDELAETRASSPRRNRRLLTIAAIALVALATGVAAWAGTRYSNVQGELDDIAAVRRVAGEFGATVLTYDYQDLEPFRERMNARATGAFRRDLRDRLSSLETLITELKSRSEATVKEIYVSQIGDAAASAIVVADARVQFGEAAARTVPDLSVELELVKVDGEWLIADVSSRDLGRAVAGDPGTAGTTTTAPPTATPTTVASR